MILENNNTKQSQYFIKDTTPKGYNLYNNNYTFFSAIYTFPWRENIIVYTPDEGKNREKYFNHNIYQREGCRLWREINTLLSISSLTDRVLSIFRQKKVRSDPSEMDIKVVIPAPT